MNNLSGKGRSHARLLVLAVVITALALGGAAASIGRAGTNGTVTATIDKVLNDDTVNLIAGTPTPGKNIGYQFTFTNTGTNTINHVVLNASISGTNAGTPVGKVVFVSSDDPNLVCSGTSTLTCTEAQLASLAHFTLTILFSTDPNPASGDRIYPNFSGTYAPQSQNTTNNRTPPKSYAADNSVSVRDYTGFAGGTINHAIAQSLALPGDPLAAAAGSFVSNVTMPPGLFLHSNSYVGVTLRNDANVLPPNAATDCPTCQPFQVTTTIPLASTVTSPANPFLEGTTTKVYSWSFTIPVAKSFSPTGVFHTDDNNANGAPLPACVIDVNGQPVPLTTAPGICTLPPVLTKGKGQNPNTVTYSGIGVANGHGYGY
jgi:hypothetical protein